MGRAARGGVGALGWQVRSGDSLAPPQSGPPQSCTARLLETELCPHPQREDTEPRESGSALPDKITPAAFSQARSTGLLWRGLPRR